MSGATFTLTYSDGQIAGGFETLQALGYNLRPLMEDLGAEGEAQTRDRFDTETAPDGTPWEPSLRAQLTGGKTLTLQGHLRDSQAYHLDGDDAVEWGSNLIYASVHQEGATITGPNGLSFTLASGQFVHVQSVTIPARAYLGISDANGEELLDIVGKHLVRALEGGVA